MRKKRDLEVLVEMGFVSSYLDILGSIEEDVSSLYGSGSDWYIDDKGKLIVNGSVYKLFKDVKCNWSASYREFNDLSERLYDCLSKELKGKRGKLKSLSVEGNSVFLWWEDGFVDSFTRKTFLELLGSTEDHDVNEFDLKGFTLEKVYAGYDTIMIKEYHLSTCNGFVEMYYHPIENVFIFLDSMYIPRENRYKTKGAIIFKGNIPNGTIEGWDRFGNVFIKDIYNGFTEGIKVARDVYGKPFESLIDDFPCLAEKCRSFVATRLPHELLAMGIITSEEYNTMISDKNFASFISCLEWSGFISSLFNKGRGLLPSKNTINGFANGLYKSTRVKIEGSKENMVNICAQYLKESYGKKRD